MTDVTDPIPEPADTPADTPSSVPAGAAPRDASAVHLGWLVAGMSAGAGAIHLAVVPEHAGDSLLDPIGFAVVGWFQLLTAAVILVGRDGRNLYRAAVVGNLAVIGLWLWSRTAGLPFGSHDGVAEDVAMLDGVATALAVGVVLVSARILMAPRSERVSQGRLAPALLGVGALALATVVMVAPGESGGSGHQHGGDEAASTGAHAALMAQIDEERCDKAFNIPAYWDEADYLGVDTYQGGAMATGAAAASADGHSHGASAGSASTDAATTTTTPDPTGGRGSAGLDNLIAHTEASKGGEIPAAELIHELSVADDSTYVEWLWWLRSTGKVGHAPGSHDAAAPDESTGMGGHFGPQAWNALTDPGQCATVAAELEQARDVALSFPTAADAIDAGYVRVAPYLPGIASHWMRFDIVDGRFDIAEPEMLLYDGNDPESHIVGLSYYVRLAGEAQPSQGFTANNDHSHRHVGLCTGPNGIIGDSATTDAECEAAGGRKADGSAGWMSHAWVVPGCESPWGVFSAENPILDISLSEASGDNDGGCSASGVRDRYGLDDPATAATASASPPAGG